MIYILIGLVILLIFFTILYWTGKLSGKWRTNRDKYDEKDYLGKGAAIWICIGLTSLFCYMIGYLILNL